MNYSLVVIFSFSIVFAAVIGLLRFHRINPAYYPFIYLIWIALTNEILSYILAHTIKNNMVNNNIYILIESLLITWQFRNWGIFERGKKLFVAVLIFLTTMWFLDVFIIEGIHKVTFYFQIVSSFLIVLMSIHTINGLIIRERRNILRNPTFLICIAFVLYFTLKVLVQTFWLYGVSVSLQFRINVAYTLIFVNLLANLIYALAVLWMPIKQRFSMPS